jgi:putative pyruvate formate lyase activating enzyme
LCPRRCGVDRSAVRGFCGASTDLEVASVCLHRGEEPPLNPIVNLFFAHCNLHCIYCQNWQISGATSPTAPIALSTLVDRVCTLLPESKGMLGFVTAAHYADHIPEIIEAVRLRGLHPVVVYNSSGYESVDTLRTLEGYVDIYLPDFKYMDTSLAAAYSHAPDYPEVATAALREMIRQVGVGLKVDDNGTAYRGLIVRHLVLPGHIDNSLQVLDHLSQLPTTNCQLPTLSLMAQYYPPRPDLPSPLDRTLSPDEYATVVDRYNKYGFDGWLQELRAQSNYRPDFTLNNPFEHTLTH